MKGLRSIPRILKINEIRDYRVSCLFNNGESRWIDFKLFFESRTNYSTHHPAHPLMQDSNKFCQIEVLGNSIGWQTVGIHTTDFEGNSVFYPYEIDPVVLFEFSTLDESRQIQIGMMIKSARKEAGLTQAELARRSGTSKYYISRLENNKSDIELLTLKKIIEAGLNRKLKIQIE